ncbi:MAG: tail fiber protein [Pirellulales bacterium]
MADPFLGEIRMFAGDYAPDGWMLCNGQLLPIKQNQALYSLLGTTYGGDGTMTFGLPNLIGRVPIHAGTGPGLSMRPLGGKGGQLEVTLTTAHLPPHSHALTASMSAASTGNASGAVLAQSSVNAYVRNPPSQSLLPLNDATVGVAGQNDAHPNLMPYACVSFMIAVQGIFPSRS